MGEYIKPLTMQQASKLHNQVKELLDKRMAAFGNRGNRGEKAASQPTTRPVWTPEDEKTLEEIMKKLSTFQRRPSNPAIAETMPLEVTIAPDAEPGDRELRLTMPSGLTNPIRFCVGQLPEFSKKPAKFVNDFGNLPNFRRRNETKPAAPETDPAVTLPTVVNGQIMPGAVDRFHLRPARASGSSPRSAPAS